MKVRATSTQSVFLCGLEGRLTAFILRLRRGNKPSLDELELWPDTIWRLAALLKAGCSPAFACTVVGRNLAQALETVRTRIETKGAVERWGAERWQDEELAIALANMVNLFEHCAEAARQGNLLGPTCLRLGLSGYRASVRDGIAAMAACWQVGQITGASLAEVFERLARYYETEIDLRQQRETALSGPKATGRILSWLPALGLALGIMMGTDPLRVLCGSLGGALVGLTGLGLAYAGSAWTSRLIRRAERGEL